VTVLTLLLALASIAGAQELDLDRWAFHVEERARERLLVELARTHRPAEVAFEHASVVDVVAGEVLPDRTVWVRAGRVHAVEPSAASTVPADVARIDASGKFLLPGLVDMHVHTSTSSGDYLLDLANGVTGVRELCGFPWLLARRAAGAAGTLLLPRLFVSGHILNAAPMGMFATVVRSPAEARERVRAQVAAGYDFVKVHNSMPLELYRAIADEARALDVRLVGHVPHFVTLAEALARGHHTFEHFKGIVLDRTLELTDEDYVALAEEHALWMCPTLTTRRIGLTGSEALRLIDGAEEMRYVSSRERARWRELARSKDEDNSSARVWDLSQAIFVDLLGTKARFLAGTDSGGGYENLVRGFALHEELRLMHELGLPAPEVVRAATCNAAEALEREDELGAVAPGQHADLVLVDGDPLLDVRHLAKPAGVMAAGAWLSRETLDGMLAGLAQIAERELPPTPDAEAREALVAEMEALAQAGMVFMDHHLEELAGLLRAAGDEERAERVSRVGVR
jgi:imidazolonepropionase-like amidohydrolase